MVPAARTPHDRGMDQLAPPTDAAPSGAPSSDLPPNDVPPSDVPPSDARPSDEFGPLRRSTTKRMVAGVAGGISDRFDVDVNIVRVVFVVLTFVGGLGAAIYLAIWALVPSDDETDEGRGAQPAGRTVFLTVLLLAAAISVGLLFATPWWGGPRLGGGIGVLWFGVVVFVLVVAAQKAVRRRSLGRLAAVGALAVLTITILVVGAFFGLVAMTGVPLAGGIGQRTWQPTSLSQVQATYRTAIGDSTVDLRAVPFTHATVHVTASVAVGRLLVEVPPGVVVDVDAHSGIGSVSYGPGGQATFTPLPNASPGPGSPPPQLVLVAEAGIGQVDLVRAAPDTPGALQAIGS